MLSVNQKRWRESTGIKSSGGSWDQENFGRHGSPAKVERTQQQAVWCTHRLRQRSETSSDEQQPDANDSTNTVDATVAITPVTDMNDWLRGLRRGSERCAYRACAMWPPEFLWDLHERCGTPETWMSHLSHRHRNDPASFLPLSCDMVCSLTSWLEWVWRWLFLCLICMMINCFLVFYATLHMFLSHFTY